VTMGIPRSQYSQYPGGIQLSRTPKAPARVRPVKIQLWGWRCERCRYEWVPRDIAAKPEGPGVCPKCKSPYWNRPRRGHG
jgi:predicted Zn-ribbon and HTH transcriptional regulator